ncbi:unnamed protein product, partial [Rotaria sp. Silwood2]
HIQFIPNNRQRPEHNYSDRTLIELRQYDFDDFSFRAVDVDNNNAEIFNIPFKQSDQYKYGQTVNQPDEIHTNAGTYKLWLNGNTRDEFHQTVNTCSELLPSDKRPNLAFNDSDQDTDDDDDNDSSDVFDDDTRNEFDIHVPPVACPKELLLETYRLGKYIEIGASNAAAQLASELASQNIRLKANSLRATENEKEFTIYVQLDGNEYGIDQNGGKIPVDVFRLTTVRELRAIFEFAYQYPPTNQYFFVNGCLAHDDSTMKSLNVGPNSLFVLFVLTHPRNFQNIASTTNDSSSSVTPVSAYWECVDCHTYNPSSRKSCKTCRRLRQDLLDQCLKESKTQQSEKTGIEPKLKTSSNQITTNNNNESTCFTTTTTKPPPNWYCVICSHHNCNNDSATICAGCGSIFMTNIEYLNFVHEQEKQLLRYQEDSKAFREDLREQAHAAYYKNNDEFECIICYELIGKNKGVLFHHCLHPMCKRCVLQMIETSTEPLLKCPHDDCTTIIGERELRGVVKDMKRDQKLVDRLNEIGVRWAESRHKTFHCITPDCKQWWFTEQVQGNNIVYCDGCKHWICMTCVAVHEGQNCLEYQEDLKIRAMNDITARKDQEHLEEMIKRKEAMHCPGCQVIIQKLSGCDWLQCTQCKMEICWPTRGPRWGPGGRGDTSGGCRCRMDKGKLCTKDCQNCH